MYSRADSRTTTVQRESFGLPGTATRSTEPEVFTFERIPAQATAVRSYVPIRPKKRCTRVMYPAKVRMHLPPPERSPAKRWLLLLSLVLLWQIYTEEPCAEDGPAPELQGFPFQPEQAAGSELLPSGPGGCQEPGTLSDHILPNTCPQPGQEPETSRFEQSAGKSMVALLVYHRLGSDN